MSSPYKGRRHFLLLVGLTFPDSLITPNLIFPFFVSIMKSAVALCFLVFYTESSACSWLRRAGGTKQFKTDEVANESLATEQSDADQYISEWGERIDPRPELAQTGKALSSSFSRSRKAENPLSQGKRRSSSFPALEGLQGECGNQ
ncbi:hypothetical protein O181_006778 [Austropuccinia psidii MF-1]|uniref:Uncharacterized protein n=1 Tax=Austropuccinia psidii MF-1 TaxID=1389203 RepID=A0A9Q3GGX3_9BASI|nr:hypothetical protein [Austropuccinia psidii MF-1]